MGLRSLATAAAIVGYDFHFGHSSVWMRFAVKSGTNFDKILIRLNDNPVKELNGVSEGIINTVSPGRYEVTVIGKKGEKESKASKVVEVQAGAMASAEFTLIV